MHVEHAQNSSAGRRNALHGRTGGVDRGASPMSASVAGRGHRQRSVCAFHSAAADVERRSKPAVDAECSAAGSSADDIDDGVDRADLVEVNRFEGNGVDACFGLAE